MGVPTLQQFDDETCRELVHWLARGFSQEEAARRAGVAPSPRLSRFFRSVPCAKLLQEALANRMLRELAPKAIRRLEGILDDEKASQKVLVDAFKAVTDRAGLGAGKDTNKPGDKDPHDMTPGELADLIERLEREKSGRAVPVNDLPAAESSIENFLD